MATVIAGMTTSLDGFVADARGSAGALYPDLAALQGSDYMNAAVEETGAVLMGRRTFEMGDPASYVGNYEFQVPIFVLTHHPPQTAPKQDERLTFTFVTDGVESAVQQAPAGARAKAGDSVAVLGLGRVGSTTYERLRDEYGLRDHGPRMEQQRCQLALAI
jgi:dihydrofolate reductase